MPLEVEIKAPAPGRAAVAAALQALGASARGTTRQSDTYFAHPSQDLAAKDEALRLRDADGACELTWKGPRLDAESKTRVELTVRVDNAAVARRLLEALGFDAVATVTKRRDTYRLGDWEVCLDDVDGVGLYLEVERVVDEADAGRHGALVAEGRALLDRLSAGASERRSYLDLLLARGM